MKLPFLASALLAAVLPAAAQVIVTENYTFPVGSPGGNIPDTGLSARFSQTLSGSQIHTLTAVRVSLNLTGSTAGNGWAGDLFVSLNRDLGSQTAILLNQVGVTGSNPAGFGYDGWNVTFRDDAAADIHTVVHSSGILTGTYQPDGRLAPTDSLRPAPLSQFDGLAGNGTWHLNLADLAPGGLMTLNSWSLELVGEAVPEPEAVAVFAGLALLGWGAWRRRN